MAPWIEWSAYRDVQCAPNAIAHKGLSGDTVRLRSMEAVGDFINAEDVGGAIVSLLLATSLQHKIYKRAIQLAPVHTISGSQLFFVTMSRYVTGSVATACSSSR